MLPHVVATLATQAALQALVQQVLSSAQICATHGSHVAFSFVPVTHGS